MLFGAKFYLNFDGKYEFDKAFQMLLTELRGRGKDDGGWSFNYFIVSKWLLVL